MFKLRDFFKEFLQLTFQYHGVNWIPSKVIQTSLKMLTSQSISENNLPKFIDK